MTLTVTLTLGLRSRVIGSAHRLTDRNIWVKFNENHSKDSFLFLFDLILYVPVNNFSAMSVRVSLG